MPKRETVGLLSSLGSVNSTLAVDQRLLSFDHKRHTRLRQMDITFRAIEKPDSNLIFEIANLLAQGRLGDVKLFRRSAEMKLFCNCDNIPQQSELNTRIHRPTLQVWYASGYAVLHVGTHTYARTRVFFSTQRREFLDVPKE